ncbi:MAG: Re/Si-specific NAD(P)(+) transhydrogenase subunit alpha, partial [Anaerolineae bacterium]|nr:Re/Si-specific NAD(P)(+) transhydrogenase subunit alpha [Anaerolineae bacterium]
GENRVAVVPEAVAALRKAGHDVLVEAEAGSAALFADADYAGAGAQIISDRAALYRAADVLVKVQKPALAEVELLREGAVLICFLGAAAGSELLQRLAARRITALAIEAVPRISRAQSMDALSSQANVAGYKAAVLAADLLPKFFPMMTTAAGTIRPAKVLVLGAGVAGLQAIATARRLGAVVWGYDVRAAVKEQVESLGAKFLELDIGVADAEAAGGYARELSAEAKQRQQQQLAARLKDFDVVITTAAVPGRPAPRLITRDAVAAMRPGSVIVDLAAETGGNCELTRAGETIRVDGVIIAGPINLPATVPVHASQMYSRNVTELLKLLTGKDGQLNLNFEDEIINATCRTHAGQLRH